MLPLKGVLVMAALVLALSPATVSPTVTAQEWVVLAVGIGLVIAVNVVLLRRVFGPLERLEATMEVGARDHADYLPVVRDWTISTRWRCRKISATWAFGL